MKKLFNPADALPLAKQLFASVFALKEGPTDPQILEDLSNAAIDAAAIFFRTYHKRVDENQ